MREGETKGISPGSTGKQISGKESSCNAGDPGFDSWVGKIRCRRDRLPIPVFLGFPGGSAGKESSCNAGDLGSIPGVGRSPGEGKGYPLQYSGLENSIQSRVSQSQTRLRDFHSSGDQQGALPFVVKTGF